MQGKRAGQAKAADRPTRRLRSHRLRSVFNDHDLPTVRNRIDLIHGGGPTRQMNHNDGPCVLADARLNRLRIHIEIVAYVGKARRCASQDDGRG